jgi:hypothetical protein
MVRLVDSFATLEEQVRIWNVVGAGGYNKVVEVSA